MNEVIKKELEKAYALHLEGKLNEAELIYNAILNQNMQNPQVLYLLANVYSQKGFNGIAVNLLMSSLEINPQHQEAYIDLGVCLKKENFDDLALAAWDKAEALGEHFEISINKATLYADSGMPDKAIELCDKGLKLLAKTPIKSAKHKDAIDHAMASVHWNKSLALLTSEQWKEGWREHKWRKNLKATWHERTKIDTPQWKGQPVDNLYLHGEQGKGDEIMYLSMLGDVLKNAKNVVLEVNDSIAPLVRMMNEKIMVVTGQDEAEKLGMKFDAKCALGDLGELYRNHERDFPGTAYMKADPERVEYYRNELKKLGDGPYVGVAWIGGTKTTRVHKRTISLGRFARLLKGVTAVSLQYGEYGDAEADKYGVARFGEASNGKDFLEQSALIEALDYVITVQQTVVHLAGALGKKTYVLVCDAPSWRYGTKSEKMPWYGSVKLIRQKKDESWDNVIERLDNTIQAENQQVAA